MNTQRPLCIHKCCHRSPPFSYNKGSPLPAVLLHRRVVVKQLIKAIIAAVWLSCQIVQKL
eukprot:4958409-Pyramimonas_sp.AAC.1